MYCQINGWLTGTLRPAYQRVSPLIKAALPIDRPSPHRPSKEEVLTCSTLLRASSGAISFSHALSGFHLYARLRIPHTLLFPYLPTSVDADSVGSKALVIGV